MTIQRKLLNRRAVLTAASAAVAGLPFGASARAAEPARSIAKPPAQGAGTESPTAALAEYAAASSSAKISAAARERAKKVIFDEMACSYFGRRTVAGELAAKYATQFGGAPEARIYGTSARAPAAYAAMANGTAGHGEEVDGTHVIGGHPGASIVHAATAMAERQRTSGAELINAVVLGYDVGVRVHEACGGIFVVRDRKHLASDFLYALGCAAAAGRLLGLDPARHAHALALVTFQANGLQALFSEKRHISKSFCNGQYAFAGISAALMAEIGLEGNEDIIGSQDGLLDAWGYPDRRHVVASGLGADFKILGANFKFYNAGQPIHAPIEAATTLITQHGIASDAIQSILIGMPDNARKVVDNRDMPNISVQDMVAADLAAGGLKLVDQPFPVMLENPTYKRLRALITVEVDPDLQREFPDGRGARVTITVKGGARHALRIDNPRGHSLRGEITWNDLAEKWDGSLPGADVGKALAAARRLEDMKDVNELFTAFAGTIG